jgi:type IVB pilus formation R64 PilN family outer membrane protein
MKQTVQFRLASPVVWAAVGALMLGGCTTPSIGQRVERDGADRLAITKTVVDAPSLADMAGPDVKGGKFESNARAADQANGPVLRHATRPWIGAVSVPVGVDAQLPSVFTDNISLNFDQPAPLRVMAERLSKIVGISVRVKDDAINESVAVAGASAGQQPLLQQIGGPVASGGQVGAPRARQVTVNMQWNGSLKGYLDRMTDLTGLSWDYREGVIVIERLKTEFFEVASFEGDTSSQMGMTGADAGTSTSASSSTGSTGGSTSSTSSAITDVMDTGKFNPVESMIKTIKQMVKDVPGSEVIRAEGSGRIAVSTNKDAMAQVREFVRSENAAMSRQVQIEFDIYSVRRDEGDQKGIDWMLALKSYSKALNMSILSPTSIVDNSAGGVTLNVMGPASSSNPVANNLGGSTSILNLLSTYGDATEQRPVNLVSTNRQWDRSANLESVAYVSETTPGTATTVGSGAPGLKTSTVTTGDRYFAQAMAMANGNIQVRFSIGLSTLVGLPTFTSGTGSAQQTVQTPDTTSIIKQAVQTLKAGQIVAITGLSRYVTSKKRQTLTEDSPLGLGGSQVLSRQREDFVIFMRATTSPQ